MAWVSVYQQLRDHRKVRDLFRQLNISRQEAIGILVLIWLWALDNADRQGMIMSATVDDIAEAAYWKGDSQKLYFALVESHWIDEREGRMYFHDWDEFNKPFFDYIDRKEKDKLRKREGNSAGKSMEIPQEFHESPSPSPNHIERDIAREEIKNQVDVDNAIKTINDKSFEFSMNGISPEFQEDAKTRLKEGTEPELIIKALSIGATKASGSGPSKCRYAISVLQGWASEGIKTVTQWTEKNAPKPNARDRPQNKVPQKGNFDQRKYTDEEIAKMFKEV